MQNCLVSPLQVHGSQECVDSWDSVVLRYRQFHLLLLFPHHLQVSMLKKANKALIVL